MYIAPALRYDRLNDETKGKAMESFLEYQARTAYEAHTHVPECDEWCPVLDGGPSQRLIDLDNEVVKDRSR